MKSSNYSRTILSSTIKKQAQKLGFDLVGIASARPFKKVLERIEDRKLSEFVNQDKMLLTNPKLHLKNACSIISVALSYASSFSSHINHNEDFHIALYARGHDYHKLMKKLLSELELYIKTLIPEANTIAYSDTGPLLEREIAQRAGLGWIGKGNNLINPDYGSYLILGEVITNLELDYDQEIKPRCGSCELCLKNCPGQALEEPYSLNYQKCISYLTQKKGILSLEERNKIGLNLWGCDNCLRVCPYNKDVPVDLHQEFHPEIYGIAEQVLNFNNSNIDPVWKESALYWRGLRILKRNTLINIANSGNYKYIPLLLEQINSRSPLIRAYAIWALAEIDEDRALSVIKNNLNKEDQKIVIKEIKTILN